MFVAQGAILTMQTGVLGAGTVLGGAGGAGGQVDGQAVGETGGDGDGFGSGLFIAGNEQIALEPGAGETVTVGGAIDDQTGSGGAGANAGAGAVALTGGGTVRLDAAGDYTGGTVLAADDTLDLGATGAAGSAPILFEGAVALRIEPGVQVANGIIGLSAGDVIDFGGITNGAAAGTVSFDPSRDRLTVSGTSGGSVTVQFDPAVQYAAAAFQPSLDAGDAGTTVTYVPCFAAGTRIDTPAGPVPVELLATGQMVNTAEDGSRPIVWLGHRRVDCRRHPSPWDVCPIRVMEGAFGAGLPRCDLYLSPDHAVFVAAPSPSTVLGDGEDAAPGALIPIRYLINGATIVRHAVDDVIYWHVELDRHEVILAEGLPCESYLDTGNRGDFATPRGRAVGRVAA